MDYVEGINLERVVREHGPLPVSDALDYLIQSARGLEAAHEKGIVHRDIKPGNLMIDRRGTVRVLDLGLARIVDASNPFTKTITGRLTQSNTYMGTIDYMAPEQAEDSHSVDHRADIYSLACTFFFLLTGREPFAGATMLKRMVAHQEHPAPSLRAIRPDVSPALEAVYQKMMAKKPEDRPASMTEVIALLQASKLSTDSDVGTVAGPPAPTSAALVGKQAPINQGGPPRPIIDSGIFARRLEAEDMLIDGKLNLWDLVMDVRSDVGVAGDQGPDQDERMGASDDHGSNLRGLAMALGEEAAAPAARKPPVANAPLPKASAPPEGREALRPAETTCERTTTPKTGWITAEEHKPSDPPKPPSAVAQPLKRSAPPPKQGEPSAPPKPPSAAPQPLKRSDPRSEQKCRPPRRNRLPPTPSLCDDPHHRSTKKRRPTGRNRLPMRDSP